MVPVFFWPDSELQRLENCSNRRDLHRLPFAGETIPKELQGDSFQIRPNARPGGRVFIQSSINSPQTNLAESITSVNPRGLEIAD